MPPTQPTLADTAESLADLARKLEAAGDYKSATEAWAGAYAALRAWVGIKLLPPGTSSANLQEMTGAQLERRGRAIAKSKASKSTDRLWKAITESKWGSQERYARERLKVSPGSLSAYRSGATPCPRPVAAKVRADFEIGDEYWPSIVD